MDGSDRVARSERAAAGQIAHGSVPH